MCLATHFFAELGGLYCEVWVVVCRPFVKEIYDDDMMTLIICDQMNERG